MVYFERIKSWVVESGLLEGFVTPKETEDILYRGVSCSCESVQEGTIISCEKNHTHWNRCMHTARSFAKCDSFSKATSKVIMRLINTFEGISEVVEGEVIVPVNAFRVVSVERYLDVYFVDVVPVYA
jgi:hypothetical protein